MKKHGLFLYYVLLTGCAALTDPTQTTTVSTYAPPSVSEVTLGVTTATLSIRSWLSSPDFIGYVVYTNDNPTVLSSIQTDDLNGYPNIPGKPFYATNLAFSALATGGQTGSAVLLNLTTGRRTYAVVTCLGSNALLASLRTNRGLIESSPSIAVEITPRPEMSFALTNYYFTNTGSGLLLSGSSLNVDTPSVSWASITSTLVASVESWSGGFYPALSPGSASSATMRVLGGAYGWGPSVPIPTSGYTSPGAPQAIAVGNVCYFKTATAHIKVLVQGFSKTPTLAADVVVITGQVAWQTNLLATGL